MKALLLFVYFGCVPAGLLAAETNLSNQISEQTNKFRVTISAPSDLLTKGIKGSTPYSADFVLRKIRDFRLMYCNPDTLRARVASGVCVLDFESPSGSHIEAKIAPSTRLIDVLKRAGVTWRPKAQQPAVRVISKHAILADDGTEEFKNTLISPGDFIIVLPIE
jgi:hypothetical protein